MATVFSAPRTALARGLHIAYEDLGSGNPAVVLIHGAFGSRSHFAAQVEHLAQRHRVVALDLHGHGDSDLPKDGFRISDFTGDVIAVCEAANLDGAVLCGHSFSGAIALEVAAARPDLVAGVVLLDGTILYPEGLRTQALSNLVPVLEGPGWAEAMQGYLGGRGFGPYDSPDLKARVMQEIGRGPGGLAAPLMRYVLSSDHASLIASSDCPLLYIHARVPTDLARLRELRPDALIASVAGSGHWMMLEVPDQVKAMLDRFLDIVAGISVRVRV